MTIKKPCLICGEPSTSSRCEEHKRDLQRDRDSRQRRTTSRWRRLSERLRRMQPFCDWCGSRDRLQVDHILPVTERPDLEYVVDNLRVLCQPCHLTRTEVTDTERVEVEARLAGRRARLARRDTQGGDPAPGSSATAPVGEDPNGISDIS